MKVIFIIEIQKLQNQPTNKQKQKEEKSKSC